MGVSRSPEELAGKLGRLATAYADLPKSTTDDAALLVKNAVLAIAPGRLRGVGKRGARLSAKYTTSGTGEEAKALVFALGPWQFIEADTHSHDIPKQRSRGRQRVAAIPNVGVFSVIHHPGSKGKHPWAKGVEASRPLVPRLYESKANFVLNRIF